MGRDPRQLAEVLKAELEFLEKGFKIGQLGFKSREEVYEKCYFLTTKRFVDVKDRNLYYYVILFWGGKEKRVNNIKSVEGDFNVRNTRGASRIIEERHSK